MRLCLRNWSGSARLFTSGVVNSPRFAWGIDIEENGLAPEEFEAPILLFLNTLVPDVASLMNDPLTAQYLDGLPFRPARLMSELSRCSHWRRTCCRRRTALPSTSPFFDIDMLDFTLIN